MKLSHATLLVKDVPQSVAFYEKAFGLKKRFIHESEQFADMESDGIALHFAASAAVKANLPSGFQENSLRGCLRSRLGRKKAHSVYAAI